MFDELKRIRTTRIFYRLDWCIATEEVLSIINWRPLGIFIAADTDLTL